MEIPESKSDKTKARKEAIEVLIVKAEDENYWLYCAIQNIWLTPDELRAYNEKGLYLWNPRFWDLRDPKHFLGTLERQEANILKKLGPLRKKLQEHKPKTKIKVDKQ